MINVDCPQERLILSKFESVDIKFISLCNAILPPGIAIKRRDERSGSSIFFGGGPIDELQMIDAGFVGEEFGLVAAHVLA